MKRPKDALVPTPPVEEDDDIGEIRGVVGFQIRLVHGTIYRNFTETFQDIDLTQKQVLILWLIDDHPDIAQTDLARRMRMDRATTMAIINRLQARHYLLRGRSPSDGRKQTLNLTDDGRKALTVAKAAINTHEQWIKSRFTEKEVGQLIEMLARIRE